ncbi:MAG: molecular chaperone HtpG, partial [Cyanobacteria bacterium J149]
FLMPLRGVIDSPDIPLNVSRSALTNNRTVRRIADYISKKIGDRLKSLYNENREEYIRCWQDIGTFVKFGSLKDEKFKKQVEDLIIFRTTYQPETETATADQPKVEVQTESGDAWESVENQQQEKKTTTSADNYTTLAEYLERNKERHENRVFYCTDPVSQSTYIELYKNQGLEVLYLDSFIDNNYFIPFLEREHPEVKFSRVDSELDSNLLSEDKSQEIVDPTTNKTRSQLIKEIFEQAIGNDKVNIKTQAIKSDDPESTPPAIVIIPEAMRRLQEMTALMQEKSLAFPENYILSININHPLIENILELHRSSIVDASGKSSSQELITMMCQHIHDLALMAQQALDPEAMKKFIARSNQLLTHVSK